MAKLRNVTAPYMLWGRLRYPWVVGALFAVFGMEPARADEGAKSHAPRGAEQIAAENKVARWNLVRDAKRYGHAEGVVSAPIEAVRDEVTDYARYAELEPSRFQRSKVVARRSGETDVYLQVKILGGTLTLWDVTRFSAPRITPSGTHIIEGKFVKGNIRDLHVIWTLEPVGNDKTLLKCDLLLELQVDFPRDVTDFHLRESAALGVERVRSRVEERVRTRADGGAPPRSPVAG